MGRDHVFLALHGLSGLQLALLENDRCIPEDKVYGASDDGVAVELTVGVGVESVLVAVNAAAVDNRPVGADTESHRLVLLWSCRVLEPHILGYKSITNGSCISKSSKLVTHGAEKTMRIKPNKEKVQKIRKNEGKVINII